jgi:hypothetical protein
MLILVKDDLIGEDQKGGARQIEGKWRQLQKAYRPFYLFAFIGCSPYYYKEKI